MLMKFISALAALAAIAMQPVQAVVLSGGGFTSTLPGSTAADRPELTGTLLEDTFTPFSFAYGVGTMTGTVQSRVVRETASGTLDFYWRISSNASSPLGLPQFQVTNFVASFYDADWRSDGPGNTAPNLALLVGGDSTHQVYFFFQDPAIGPGQTSYFLLLHTDATQYAKTAYYVVNPLNPIEEPLGPENYYATFAPAVPEPQAYAMLLAGLAVVAGVARRKR
jgi:hypothetical protein